MTRPLEWLTAIRDHPARPSSVQQDVLTKPALRLDWATGTGYASVDMLAADSGTRQATVRSALAWARGTPPDSFFLARTRRGHRLGNGSVVASEWRLRLPVDYISTANGLAVENTSTASSSNLNRQQTTSQLPLGTPHLDPIPLT